MHRDPRKIVTFEAVSSRRYDGLIRILIDAERFGLDLVELSASQDGDGAVLRCTLAVNPSVDAEDLLSRFRRHPSLVEANLTCGGMNDARS